MKSAILYTRVSTDEQANFGFSLEHQKDRLLEFCKIQNIEVVKIFTDDYSAKNFDRPEWKKLEEFAKHNKKNVDVILFTRWDRFSRNAGDAYGVIKKLKTFGITVNSVENPLDLSKPDNKLMLSFYLAMPEIENDKISIRTFEGMRKANKEGYWTGKAPYGYVNVRLESSQKPSLSPSKEAGLVREAFSLVNMGIFSAEEIRRKLVHKGLRLQKQAFYNMLRNVVYIGKIKIKAWGDEEESIIDALHPPLVDENVFYEVQNLLNGKKKCAIKD